VSRVNGDGPNPLHHTATALLIAFSESRPLGHLAVDWAFFDSTGPLFRSARACVSAVLRVFRDAPRSRLLAFSAFLAAGSPRLPGSNFAVDWALLHLASNGLGESRASITAVLRISRDASRTGLLAGTASLVTVTPASPASNCAVDWALLHLASSILKEGRAGCATVGGIACDASRSALLTWTTRLVAVTPVAPVTNSAADWVRAIVKSPAHVSDLEVVAAAGLHEPLCHRFIGVAVRRVPIQVLAVPIAQIVAARVFPSRR